EFVGYSFVKKSGQRVGADVLDKVSNVFTFSLDGDNDGRLAGANAAGSAASAALVPMPVFGKTANECFINFNNPSELRDVFDQRRSDLVAHRPRGFIGTKAHIAHDLQCAHSLLASQNKVNDAEPFVKRLVRVFKDCASKVRKAISIRGARPALPMEWLVGRGVVKLTITATRAANSVWPSSGDQISLACLFVREHRLKLGDGHLMDGLWAFTAGHDGISNVGIHYHA